MSLAESNPPQIICTVDVVLLTLQDEQLKVALLKRDHEPFKGAAALPGVYVQPSDKNIKESAERALKSKTGIVSPYLEQLAAFSGPDRDPRGWSISNAYYALVPASVIELANCASLELRSVDDPRLLPFDHSLIVDTAVERLRVKSQYSSLPCFLAGETFTIPELQRIYENILGEPRNKVSFRRKLDELDILEEIHGEKAKSSGGKRATLYRLNAKAEHELSLLRRGL